MKKVYRRFRNISAFVGFVLLYGAASASDYYTMELRQVDPDSVNNMLSWAFILLIPMALHLLRELWRELWYRS